MGYMPQAVALPQREKNGARGLNYSMQRVHNKN